MNLQKVLQPTCFNPSRRRSRRPKQSTVTCLAEGEEARSAGRKGCTGQESSAGTLFSWLVTSSEEEARRDPGVLTSRRREQKSRDDVSLLNLLPSGEGKREMRVTSAILLATMLLPHICGPLFNFCPRFTFLSSPSTSSPVPEPVHMHQGSICHEVVVPNLISPADSFEFGGNKVIQAVPHCL